MSTPKPQPPAGKKVSKEKGKGEKPRFERKPHLTNKPFQDSEQLRKLQSELRRNSNR